MGTAPYIVVATETPTIISLADAEVVCDHVRLLADVIVLLEDVASTDKAIM